MSTGTTTGARAASPAAGPRPAPSFGAFVRQAAAKGRLVVQPRMGFGDPALMRAGLLATRGAVATTVGTLTLDSYTRTGDHAAAARALAEGVDLNGYPIVVHGPGATRALLDGVHDAAFPVQVRHGSAAPYDIVAALLAAGLHATEGGPVSYCLPYGRVPLRTAVANWAAACELLASGRAAGVEPHLESFGGCMLGQLCPPSLLVAISVLEGLFFRRHGLRSVSLSYAQQTNERQDREAVGALRRLAGELLADVDWHVVVYAYMGVFPRTPHGARGLLAAAARLAAATGSERLIVKTVTEAYRIPTIAENVEALELAAAEAAAVPAAGGTGGIDGTEGGGEVYAEARCLVDAVLDLDDDIGRALVQAFARGLLDVPYCLHDDNRGAARSYIDGDGCLRWADTGALPIPAAVGARRRVASGELLSALRYVERRYDGPAAGQPAPVPAQERVPDPTSPTPRKQP